MLYNPDRVYAIADGDELTGEDLFRVADLFVWMSSAGGLSWWAGAALEGRAVQLWPLPAYRKRFRHWVDVNKSFDAIPHDATDRLDAASRAALESVEVDSQHDIDVLISQFRDSTSLVLARTSKAVLTDYTAVAFLSRVISTARQWSNGDGFYRYRDLPSVEVLDRAAALLAERWAQLEPDYELIANAPVWDNALRAFNDSKSNDSWWRSWLGVFESEPACILIAEQFVPGYTAIRARRRPAVPTRAARQSSTWADDFMRASATNSAAMVDIYNQQTRLIQNGYRD
ncbi:hypothetical protein [Cellulomonas fengjieae]|uniref:DUF4037 domain-containing protein n=1 Tax=Cellulomonas fengjieae TaxID=2819978 RepID=A0ABS3SNS3_9CELL|nr:hypothetical protein [Cellulomonas fengjieae]MBO3086586.1 hypothetical protein [Cellulomonas fengjieae]QVI66561.1 hypothetical protein KG102_02855 [Cellulomonas fengjieae]